MNNELRKATRNRVQFTNDDSAIKTLWLMICSIEDKRAAKRAKQGQTLRSDQWQVDRRHEGDELEAGD